MNAWREDVCGSHCTAAQSARLQIFTRLPEQLPKGDNRFAPKRHDATNPRVYVCDSCSTEVTAGRKSAPFDGQYVNTSDVAGRGPAELKKLYTAGYQIDVRWFCSRCHRRPGEALIDTRKPIGVVDYARVARTQDRLNKGLPFFHAA